MAFVKLFIETESAVFLQVVIEFQAFYRVASALPPRHASNPDKKAQEKFSFREVGDLLKKTFTLLDFQKG